MAGLAIAVAFVVGNVAATAVMMYMNSNRGPVASGRPGDMPRGSYRIDIVSGSGELTRLTISPEGDECDVFAVSPPTQETCLIATILIPSAIGGQAFGELNNKHTPAFDALVWRARAGADATVCSRGGLEGAFALSCEQAATSETYELRTDTFTVRVPIGGALASPGASG